MDLPSLDGRRSAARESLLEECRVALRAVRPDAASLAALLARCLSRLEADGNPQPPIVNLAEELEAIALMIEGEPVVWPEDVARFESLARQIRERSMFRFGQASYGSSEPGRKGPPET